jgi:transposase-like protein
MFDIGVCRSIIILVKHKPQRHYLASRLWEQEETTVTCHNCQTTCNRFGKHRNGLQRYRCSQCRKTFTEDHAQPLGTMRLSIEKAISILKLMLEGMSIRSIERITEVHRDTIMHLLLQAGEKCDGLLRRKLHNIAAKRNPV